METMEIDALLNRIENATTLRLSEKEAVFLIDLIRNRLVGSEHQSERHKRLAIARRLRSKFSTRALPIGVCFTVSGSDVRDAKIVQDNSKLRSVIDTMYVSVANSRSPEVYICPVTFDVDNIRQAVITPPLINADLTKIEIGVDDDDDLDEECLIPEDSDDD